MKNHIGYYIGKKRGASLYIPIANESEPFNTQPSRRGSKHRLILTVAFCLVVAFIYAFSGALRRGPHPPLLADAFYSNIATPQGICEGPTGRTVSHSGFIGLKGDSDETPKRSFFWYFEAEVNPENAPIILTIGGGPGSSGMMNPVFGQSACVMTSDGLVPNSNRWTERFNLIALDHPIGVGFSHGTRVNNSRSAAIDVYDFLQKFFRLHPHLIKNQFVVSGGSYGGVYVPNIATVIQEQNRVIAQGKGQPEAVHINLEALIISNPFSDPIEHFSWLLQYRCVLHDVYNSTTCRDMYSILPTCLESIQYAYQHPSVENRVAAEDKCALENGNTNGTVLEDIRRKVDGKCNEGDGDLAFCHPEFEWVNKFFNNATNKHGLGVPSHLNFTSFNLEVAQEFQEAGDLIQPHQLLYEPLLASGIRVLHYVGAQDANCAWPGVFSFLKLLRTPFQDAFINAPDIPWPTKEEATVRVVGEGAGNMTFILVAQAGHFTVKDQPALAKRIVEHWIENRPYV